MEQLLIVEDDIGLNQGLSQQTQSPVFPARDMLCENPYIFG